MTKLTIGVSTIAILAPSRAMRETLKYLYPSSKKRWMLVELGSLTKSSLDLNEISSA